MKRGLREYWEEQLSEYRNSGLTIQEYSDLKDLPYETGRRWIHVLKKGTCAGSCFVEAGGIDFANSWSLCNFCRSRYKSAWFHVNAKHDISFNGNPIFCIISNRHG